MSDTPEQNDINEMGADFNPELRAAVYPDPAKKEFKPFVGRPVAEVAAKIAAAHEAAPIPPDAATTDRVSQLEAAVQALLLGTKRTSEPARVLEPLDFARLDESAAYDLSIPIVAIDHGLPESMKVELEDPNYVPRWVHTHPKRLGPMKAVGFTIVTEQDLAKDLNLEIEVDENGAYRYSDVILMKIPKIKYFGALRRNHETAVRAVNTENAHQAGKKMIEDYLEEKGGNAYTEAHNQKRLNVYTPGTTV